MKRVIALLSAVAMAFCFTACNTHPESSETTRVYFPETDPPDEDQTESNVYDNDVKIVFTNDSISMTLNKFLLDAATGTSYKMSYDGVNVDEAVQLNKLIVSIYDISTEDILYQLTFPINYDLRSSENLTASVSLSQRKPGVFKERFIMDVVQNIESLSMETYPIYIQGIFQHINGDNKLTDSFTCKSTMTIIDETDVTTLPQAKALLTQNGAVVSITYSDLQNIVAPGQTTEITIKEIGLCAQQNTSIYFNSFDQQILNDQEYSFNMQYDDILKTNQELYYAHEDNGLIYAMLGVVCGDNTNNITEYIMVVVTDVKADYEIPKRHFYFDEANPDKPVPIMPSPDQAPSEITNADTALDSHIAIETEMITDRIGENE